MDKFQKNEFCIKHWRWAPCLCKIDYAKDCHVISDATAAASLAAYHAGHVTRSELEALAKTMIGETFEVQWTYGVA